METRRKKIGIMGGTFDPIHIGHLILGEKTYEQLGLDKILFMPAGNPPHKQNLVPRVGEKIYLSDKQINNLISLLEEEYYHNPQTEEWKESIRRFTNIEEVAYNAANGTIHIELSTI